MTKKYDLVAVVGEYTNNNGEKKAKFKNVGMIGESEKGLYVILDRTFNPAGLPNPDDKDSVFLSAFEPKEKQDKPKQASYNDLDDDAPF